MRCERCGFANPEGKKFCEECGTTLVQACPSCGVEVRPNAKFCGDCGTPLAGPGQQPAATRRTGKATPRARKTPRRVVSPTTAQSCPTPPEAERRHLTVLFCDLVGSTQLSAQLDPEDYRAVVQQYQQTCTEVIQRHDGYLAQYLGDGLLIYFGYPAAHEDDARRAVRTGLEIVEAIKGQTGRHALPVRIGIHTGLVVIGDIGAGSRTEQLALGETPNLAARLQGLAEPNTVLISAATQRLITEQFESQPFGSHLVKGIETRIAVYHVQSERQHASPLAGRSTLTPLVGREQEVGLLVDRWEQAKEGRGQVVLLSGEPGIGKSRLAYTLREHVANEGALLFEARCSPYHQHSAFYPLIEVLQRTLLFTRQDTDEEKVEKLGRTLALYNLQDNLPLFTALLSLPTPSLYPPLILTPQKQKEQTLQALLQLMAAQAERQVTTSVWEDLHWADPSSLEFLSLLVDQIPTTKLLLVLTFRPEFTPPWKPRSHISQLVLNRLGKKQVEVMVEEVAAGKELSPEVIEQILSKTDGVPLFIEEITKSVVESVGATDRSPLQTLAIPATLQEALLARLDRLSTARQLAQLGATLGREFSYELLNAVAPINETDLQAALTKLVGAEILYQRGVGEQARYFFKHALIQDTAYQSLLKSTRQQYHQQIAQALEEQFPDIKETQPELVAHHYTEAGLGAQAVTYWQQAGGRAAQQSANAEAISHLTKGLEVVAALLDTHERSRQELRLHMVLGPALIAAKGNAAPEVERTYARAVDLCRQVGETVQLFPVLFGLRSVYLVRGEIKTAHELGEQLFSLAENIQELGFLLEARIALGNTFFLRGDLVSAYTQFEHALKIYDPEHHRSHALMYGLDPGVFGCSRMMWILWFQGYPDQALRKTHETLALAHEIAHPFSLAVAGLHAMKLHLFRRDTRATQQQAETTISLCKERGFASFLGQAIMFPGWVLAEQGVHQEGIAQIREGLATCQATGAMLHRTFFLAFLADSYWKAALTEEGLSTVAEALALVDKTGERYYEAELYRLKGELTLQQEFQISGSKFQAPNTQPLISNIQVEVEQEAEECFLKAIAIAQKQQAKSWELRAATSLARLRQQQGKKAEAHKLLSEVYNWFTEGFDTKDLQEAKALIEALSD
jgi:predicted ATPase/class 3 adenylate cyclase